MSEATVSPQLGWQATARLEQAALTHDTGQQNRYSGFWTAYLAWRCQLDAQAITIDVNEFLVKRVSKPVVARHSGRRSKDCCQR